MVKKALYISKPDLNDPRILVDVNNQKFQLYIINNAIITVILLIQTLPTQIKPTNKLR